MFEGTGYPSFRLTLLPRPGAASPIYARFRVWGAPILVQINLNSTTQLSKPSNISSAVLGFGFWVVGFGLWVVGFGFWVLGFG